MEEDEIFIRIMAAQFTKTVCFYIDKENLVHENTFVNDIILWSPSEQARNLYRKIDLRLDGCRVFLVSSWTGKSPEILGVFRVTNMNEPDGRWEISRITPLDLPHRREAGNPTGKVLNRQDLESLWDEYQQTG